MTSIDRFPRVALCHRPTPLEHLPRLSAHLRGPQIYIKRDDCTGLATGGNKSRKLEFLMADALAQGATTVITLGGPQSNHARQTAAAAAVLGLRCELVLPKFSKWHGPLYETNGNLLLDGLFGAAVHLVDTRDAANERVAQISARIRGEGGKAYVIPIGGSTPLGALGYVDAAAEYAGQVDAANLAIDYVIVTTGSCTTHAGLVVGFDHLNRREKIIGMSISLPGAEATATVRDKARATAELLGWPTASLDERVTVKDEYLGAGYGQPTESMLEAVALVARQEGILLDPVYTGKAMSGLIGLVRSGFFKPQERVVFWHTGGLPALFAYQDAFEPMVAGSRRDA